jgi:enoyl-CoA hydratase
MGQTLKHIQNGGNIMTNNKVVIEKRKDAGILTINNPPANSLSSLVTEDLNYALDELLADKEVKSILLTGAGSKVFVSGADIRELEAFDEAMAITVTTRAKEVLGKLFECSKPTTAAINGHTMGGGLELALHCDFRVTVEKAKFGLPEINLGVIPGVGGTQLLPWLIGIARARWLLFSGETVSAQHALEIGLVDRLVEEDSLMDEALRIGKTFSTKPPLAYQAVKKALRAGREMPFSIALQEETSLFGKLCSSQDKAEGVRAFFEKRPPQFKGT